MYSSCLASVTHFSACGSRVTGRIGSLFASIVMGHAVLFQCLSVLLLMDTRGSRGFSGHCPLRLLAAGFKPKRGIAESVGKHTLCLADTAKP